MSVIADASPLSRTAIWDYAERVAAAHDVFDGDEADLLGLVRDLGGRVDVSESLISSEALTVRGPGDFVIHLPRLTSNRRDRFTIAHELGHYFLHYRLPGFTDARSYGRGQRNVAETQANYFAGALLMPSARFGRVWRELRGDAWSVAERFGVSESAAAVRAQSLGLS